MWSNSNSYHPHPPTTMMWPDSPSFVNGVHVHSPMQLHGVPKAPSHILSTVFPIHHHHVGSAPVVNRSFWDMRHTYVRESPEASSFNLDSFGSMGFSGNSTPHPLELASHNIFHFGGNKIDPSLPSSCVGLHSPQQRCHMFLDESPMIPMLTSFNAPNERVRSHRNEARPNQVDNKKHYELDIDRIVCGEDTRTTLMIKNIPNKYVDNPAFTSLVLLNFFFFLILIS